MSAKNKKRTKKKRTKMIQSNEGYENYRSNPFFSYSMSICSTKMDRFFDRDDGNGDNGDAESMGDDTSLSCDGERENVT